MNSPGLLARLGKQSYLTASLVTFLLLEATFFNSDTATVVRYVVLGLVVIAGPLAVSQKRWHAAVAVALAVLMVVPGLISTVRDEYYLYNVSLLASAGFFGALTLMIGRRLLFMATEVSTETLWAAINVYVLLGVMFSFFYSFADIALAGAFNGTEHVQNFDVKTQTFLYFSFVTMSTLGYGDITPNVPVVATLAYLQALIGQLYVAILIARLVAMYSGSRGSGA